MSSLSDTELDTLVAEAVVDCYDEHEQLSGLFTMIENLGAVRHRGSRCAGGGGAGMARR